MCFQSRTQHETGLKHKGNYERFIRDMYRKGAKDKHEKEEEAAEIARIEAAAAVAMGQTPSTPAIAGSSKPVAATKPVIDKFANYSTPESLGFKEDPEVEKRRLEQELRQQEGIIGQWERVVKPSASFASMTTNGKQSSSSRKEDVAPDKVAEHEEEQERPTARRWLQEKSTADDDDWDPSQLSTGFKLKRKVLTLSERQEQEEKEREAEERKKRRLEQQNVNRQRASMASGGWQQVDPTNDGAFEFDVSEAQGDEDADEKPRVKAEDGVKQEESASLMAQQESSGGDVDADTKPDVKPEVAASSTTGFKKRKMHGSAAVRKK
ncbi:hypothetical protein OIO90_000578 [Microbotryomycetes sp. JL221]|nr:hypothetical protein OIO90_000578 [Microbotryomycetes sp. JL221]